MVFGIKKKATEEALRELQQNVKELRDELRACDKANENTLAETQRKLEADFIKSLEKLGNESASGWKASVDNAEKSGRTYTDKTIHSLSDALSSRINQVEHNAKNKQEDLEGKIKTTEMELRVCIQDEVIALCKRFDDAIDSVNDTLTKSLERLGADMEQSTLENRRSRESVSCEICEIRENSCSIRRQVTDEFEELKASIKKADEVREIRGNRLHGEMSVQMGKLKEKIEECDERAMKTIRAAVSDAAFALAAVKEGAQLKLDELSTETTRLATTMSEVENFATKRVEWVINNATKLKCDFGLSKGRLHTSWFSPKFDAAGCYGLQLELQMFRPSEDELAGKQRHEVGNLAIFLWACKGLTIAFRLYIGSKSMNMERTFNGRVPYGTPRLCWLLEQVNTDDDTLTVGVEFLESVREIEHRIQVPALVENPEVHVDGDHALVAAHDVAKNSVEGALFFRRHISHRLLDQVHREVELMRSRMVRKIDWRVQHAASLRSCFPKDEPICSPHFNAAGVEKMQFVFYPSGYSSAHNGFCSLFLHGPAGASLSCSLSLGKQKRKICHSFDEPGAFGRTNFCSWETPGLTEPDGTLVIEMEIEEAHQDMHTTALHPKIVAGDARPQSKIDGSDTPIESIVKVVRSSGKGAPALRKGAGTPGVEDHLVLPSVWIPKQLGDAASEYRRFNDLPPKIESAPSIENSSDNCDRSKRPLSSTFTHGSNPSSANVNKRPVSASIAIRSSGNTGLRKLASVPALRR